MISELDATVPAPTSAQKRRGVKPESSALFVAGEAPRGFWVVTSELPAGDIMAVLSPRGLTDAQRAIVIGLTPEDFGQSQSLAMAWNLADVWCRTSWRKDMEGLAKVAPLPFPKAQRLLFA